MAERITTYSEFYQFYLTEHQSKTSRVLHFVGIFLPMAGYGFAWVGHAFFEKNRPAIFKYPFWSLISDFKLFFEILFGKKSFAFRKDQ